MSLMGIDVGTTGCKVVAFDEKGAVLAQAGLEYPLLNPHPGWFELEPDLVWSHICDCLRKVNEQLAHDPVSALCISSQGEAVIPVSRDGRALANSPVSSDSRNRYQTSQVEEALGLERIYEITGQPLSAIYTLPKAMWWRDNMPAVFEGAWKFLCYTDFVAMRLGMDPVIDYGMAARTLLFDVRSLDWSDELMAVGDIRRDQLATPVPSGAIIGELRGELAQDLGFRGAVKVVTGGHDQPCGALGAGVLETGTAMYAIGTTEALVAVIAEPHNDLLQSHVSCYPHVAPDTFITLAGNQTGGRLLRWYRDELGAAERSIAEREGRDVYDVIVEQIDDEPGDMLLLPYFVGSGSVYEDPTATGAIVGLSFNSQRKDIVRAILEGLTYEQALVLRNLDALNIEINQLTAIGGGARSDRWIQIKSDITNLPIRVIHTSEAVSLGAAMLAGWATGVYGDLAEAAREVISERKTFTPRADRVPCYQRQITRFAELYHALKPIYGAMAEDE